MATTTTVSRESAPPRSPAREATVNSEQRGAEHSSALGSRAPEARRDAAMARLNRPATDDEILGIERDPKKSARDSRSATDFDASPSESAAASGADTAYRKTFATPEEARRSASRFRGICVARAGDDEDGGNSFRSARVPAANRCGRGGTCFRRHDARSNICAHARPGRILSCDELGGSRGRDSGHRIAGRAAAARSGALDADHQRALVSFVTGRARQALPGIAKRVLHEWTSTVVAPSQRRRRDSSLRSNDNRLGIRVSPEQKRNDRWAAPEFQFNFRATEPPRSSGVLSARAEASRFGRFCCCACPDRSDGSPDSADD